MEGIFSLNSKPLKTKNMKKLIVAAIVLFMGTTAFSQGVDFGIKVGANFINFEDASQFSNKTGFQAGIFGGIKFKGNFGVQADILYSQQGSKFRRTAFKLDYVNVPIVVKYYLVRGLNLQAGPQFGFVVDDNVTKVLGSIYKAEKSDISGIAGAGYDFLGFRIDARYNFGINHVVDGAKSRKSVYSLALGYSFL